VHDEELDLVLSRLMEFLGHRNQIVSAFAVNEVRKLGPGVRSNLDVDSLDPEPGDVPTADG